MERNSTAKKIIFGILDVLLVIGAIACIVTIDQGRWIISNPAFYQPEEETLQEATTIPSVQAGEDVKVIPQTGQTCLKQPMAGDPDWDTTYLMLRVYHNSTDIRDGNRATTAGVSLCE